MVKDLIVPIGCLVLGFLLGQLNMLGKRRGIGEARFDSKTGKEIK